MHRSPTALGFSKPHPGEGACVTLLMHPLEAELHRNPYNTRFLLGHVLAHEIGHVVEGSFRHSETGLMKADWSAKDVMNMSTRRLRFTPFDIELILGGLQATSYGPTGAAH